MNYTIREKYLNCKSNYVHTIVGSLVSHWNMRIVKSITDFICITKHAYLLISIQFVIALYSIRILYDNHHQCIFIITPWFHCTKFTNNDHWFSKLPERKVAASSVRQLVCSFVRLSISLLSGLFLSYYWLKFKFLWGKATRYISNLISYKVYSFGFVCSYTLI